MVRYCLALLAVSAVACVRQAAPDSDRTVVKSDAVVSFRTPSEVVLLSLSGIERVTWSDAAWQRVEYAQNGRYMAVTQSAVAPVLFVAERKREGRRFSISTMPVNPDRNLRETPPASFEPRPLPDWCAEQSWISGFFIEGVGPRPTEPVVLEYRTESGTYRLLVDPRRNSVRGTPAFTISDEELWRADIAASSTSVEVQLASRTALTIPMLVRSTATEVTATASDATGRMGLNLYGIADETAAEWSVYFLEPLNGMINPDSSAALDDCGAR